MKKYEVAVGNGGQRTTGKVSIVKGFGENLCRGEEAVL